MFNPDILIFIAFLLLNLIIGIQVYVVQLNTLLNEELAFERLANMMHELNHTIHAIRDRLSLSLTKITPAKLVDQVLWAYQTAIGEGHAYSEVVVKCFTTFKKIACDIEKITLLLSNTLQRAQVYNPIYVLPTQVNKLLRLKILGNNWVSA